MLFILGGQSLFARGINACGRIMCIRIEQLTLTELARHVAHCKTDPKRCICTIRVVRAARVLMF
jgi:hypothetical protein